MNTRTSNIITLELVKKLREIKNQSMKNYSYEAAKINIKTNGLNGIKEIKEIREIKEIKEINKINNDFLFIHKYGLDIWLKLKQ